jgi:phage portal protein BeeE
MHKEAIPFHEVLYLKLARSHSLTGISPVRMHSREPIPMDRSSSRRLLEAAEKSDRRLGWMQSRSALDVFIGEKSSGSPRWGDHPPAEQ